MRAEIIAVGTELLLGQIVNSNAQYLSRGLAELGVDVYYQTVVGDNKDRIVDAIRIARSRAELLLFTGGLGPTMDDLTREALAEYLGRGIILHEPTMDKIVSYFTGRGGDYIESNRKQALLIEGAAPLRNDTGLAVGNAISVEGTHYMLLPGPPREMKPMFENDGATWLKEQLGSELTLYSVILKFAGIGESSLEELLIDLIKAQQDPTIAPYASEGEVTIRVSTKAKDAQEASQRLQSVLEAIRIRTIPYLYAEDNVPIESTIIRLLTEQQRTLTLVESCTGGLVSQLITSIPGSAVVFLGGVVTYSNLLKMQQVGVPAYLLEGEDAPGAISAETAKAMAEGMRKASDSDYALSITGNAGPAAAEEKPVGLVYIGLAERGRETRVVTLQLSGDREGIRLRATKRALYMLWLCLTGKG